jgi:hypothetical protein
MKIHIFGKLPNGLKYHREPSSLNHEKIREVFPTANEIWYWYAGDATEGMGILLVRDSSKYGILDLTHCSRYGPLDKDDSTFTRLRWFSSLEEIKNFFIEDGYPLMEPLVEAAILQRLWDNT